MWNAGRVRRTALWVLGFVLAGTVLVAVNTLRSYAGLFTGAKSPAGLSALLSPAYQVRKPEGQGPFPTALLFSGCDGPHDNLERWAADLNAMGWAAVIVDSHGPRRFNDAQLWRLVCTGQVLGGAERAGDVAVALEDVRHMDFVDPDNLALIGASHGGWAILDLLALLGVPDLPFNLTAWPTDDVLSGVGSIVLYYPYCGIGSQVNRLGWQADVPALFLLVEGDTVADETACLGVIDRMQSAGRPVEYQMFQNVTHGFDQQDKAMFSPLRHDPAATDQASMAMTGFLARHAP
jgi:dienelactone hydrolase